MYFVAIIRILKDVCGANNKTKPSVDNDTKNEWLEEKHKEITSDPFEGKNMFQRLKIRIDYKNRFKEWSWWVHLFAFNFLVETVLQVFNDPVTLM